MKVQIMLGCSVYHSQTDRYSFCNNSASFSRYDRTSKRYPTRLFVHCFRYLIPISPPPKPNSRPPIRTVCIRTQQQGNVIMLIYLLNRKHHLNIRKEGFPLEMLPSLEPNLVGESLFEHQLPRDSLLPHLPRCDPPILVGRRLRHFKAGTGRGAIGRLQEPG